MILLDNISIQFGGEYLFKNITLQIGSNDRIGLVGANGTGKTTLLKILMGMTQPDAGTIQKANYVSVGYLPQETVFSVENTLYNEAKSAFSEVNQLEDQLEEVNWRIRNFDPQSYEDEKYRELIDIQGEIQHKLEVLDAYRMQSETEKVLMGLGFSTDDFNRSTLEFSGGWQMRIALAKLLLSNPALLLLDEPTNHLDLDSLRWLEDYLRSYIGSIIIVSHDRTFLDNMTNKTFALSNCKIEIYSGNYSFYEKESRERKALLQNAAKNQQQQLKQTQQFIDRFRYKATKARQVQSRIKQLEKIDLIEIENDEDEIHFNFTHSKPSGAIVLEVSDLTKKYVSIQNKKGNSEEIIYKTVFENLNFTIERGDRIALVGVNGAGKSTMSRILSNTEKQTSGEIKFGYNVITGYYAQNQVDELQSNMEVLEVAESEASVESNTQIRTLLGCFLFKGDDVFKKVRVLSGGEKSRLALAKMLLKPANFLILDEPTNHLDMRSKKVLQEALIKFDGTYIIVSHDRHFLDPVVNKVIEVRNQSIKIYLGNISDYINAKEKEVQLYNADISSTEKNKKNNVSLLEKERKRIEAEQRQKIYKLTKPHKDNLDKIEKLIKEKEKTKAEYEKQMSDPDYFSDSQRVKTVSREYRKINNDLNELYDRWAEVSYQIEKLIKDNFELL